MLKNKFQAQDLSKLLKISKSAISRRLNSKPNTYFIAPEVKKFCEYYNLDASFFLEL